MNVRLGKPVEIAGRKLKNRLAFSSHISNLNEESGQGADISRCVPGKAAARYYARRAAGGAALIITEQTPVHATAFQFRAAADSGAPRFFEGISEVARGCHEHGAFVIARLNHPGSLADFDLSFLPAVSPSGFAPPSGFHGGQAATESQIREIVDGFAATAHAYVKAGFDGIEIDAGPLSLMEQFWSPALNVRTDRLGGVEGGRQFALAVFEAVRAAVGPNALISVFTTLEPDPAIGIDAQARASILEWIAQNAGGNILHLGLGTYSALGAANEDAAGDLRAHGIADLRMDDRKGPALIVSGGILDAQAAEQLVRDGTADIVGLTRAMIADPDFATLVTSGQAGDIRPCTACNQNCRDRRSRDYSIRCMVNPTAGCETLAEPIIADRSTQVTIVGAGPAGLEAALSAARQGHRVQLLEKADDIGGQLNLIGAQPMRKRFALLIEWYRAQLNTHQVEILTGTEITQNDLTQYEGSPLILATGSLPDRNIRRRSAPHVQSLPGLTSGNVATVEDVLSGAYVVQGRVLLLDDCDDWKSLGSALWLARSGANVTLVTRNANPGTRIVAGEQLDKLRQEFERLQVEIIGDARVEAWHGSSATLINLLTQEKYDLPFDYLVSATTGVANNFLVDTLGDKWAHSGVAGDCVAPRYVGDAIREGRAAGLFVTSAAHEN